MKNAATLLSLATLSAACLPAGGCLLTDPFQAKRTQTLHVAQVEHAALRVVAHNGSIQVLAEAGRKDVEVVASIVATGDSQAEADRRVHDIKVHCDRGVDQLLIVRAEFPERRRTRERASFVVRLPSVAGAKLTTSNGSITARSLSGKLEASSSNGTITVDQHDGAIDVRTSNGTVSAERITGPATIQTSNGRIDVQLDASSTGPLLARTSNGSIRATVGPHFAGRLSLRTSNGGGALHQPDPSRRQV